MKVHLKAVIAPSILGLLVGAAFLASPTRSALADVDKLPPLPTGAVQVTSSAQYQKDVEEESKKRTVILDFSKDGCGPCVKLAPILDQRYKADNGKWQYARIDGTAVTDVWAKFNNPWFPSLIAIKDGKELGRLAGFSGDEKALVKWINDAAEGRAPKTDPLVLEIVGETEMAKASAISYRHPVVLRLYDNKTKDTTAQGVLAAKLANGDGGKWTLGNVDATSEIGKKVVEFVGPQGQKADWAKHVVMYQGLPRYEDNVQAFGLATADEKAMKDWITIVLSHKYVDNPKPNPSPEPTDSPTVEPTNNPTDSPTVTPDPQPNPPDPQPNPPGPQPNPPGPEPGPPGPDGDFDVMAFILQIFTLIRDVIVKIFSSGGI